MNSWILKPAGCPAEGRYDVTLAPNGGGRTLGQQELLIRGFPNQYWCVTLALTCIQAGLAHSGISTSLQLRQGLHL